MVAPTMDGFEWSPRQVPAQMRELPGDLGCLRDAFGALFDWPPGSDEWSRFIEAPLPDDVERLIDHLGLAWFDPEYLPHSRELHSRLDHPGITFYKFPALQSEHCMYQPHVRHLLDLPPLYYLFQLELYRVVVDTRRPAARCVVCSAAEPS